MLSSLVLVFEILADSVERVFSKEAGEFSSPYKWSFRVFLSISIHGLTFHGQKDTMVVPFRLHRTRDLRSVMFTSIPWVFCTQAEGRRVGI